VEQETPHFPGARNRTKVHLQGDSQRHSDTNDLEQARYFARSLTNWNLAAQVYDRVAQNIIFSARSYAEKRTDDSIEKS